MRNLFFIVWALLIIAAGVMVYIDMPRLSIWIILLLCGALLLLVLFYRMMVLPGRVVTRGFELLESQDFNNRLVEVGERNADRTVRLFNSMIDRLRNERLLNMERESFLELLVDASPLGVLMLDLDGKVSLANDAFLHLCGLGKDVSLEGKGMEELPSNVRVWLEGIPYQQSVVFRPGDSRIFRGTHLSFVQSGFNRHFYLLENLTEEVAKAERSAYEKVIRIMSHEVNNTMGGVRTVIGMMIEETQEDDLKEVLVSCDRRCGEVCTFINDYADVVRLPNPELHRMDLGEMIHSSLPFLRTLAPDNIEIETSIESDLIISGDATQLEQVIVNIVKNAVESFRGYDGDYREEKRKIEIAAYREGRNIVLEISNNGSPIPDQVASQLFSPFFTTKPDGKGLGLTLTAEILSNHHALWSLRTNPDLRTHFSIRFPFG